MNADQVEAHLRSQAPSLDGMTHAFGRRGDAAFVRLASLDDPDRWAVVASPGNRWFAVHVPGGFSLDHFNEDLEDDEVRVILDDFIGVAVSYVRSGAARTTIGRLKSPALIVSTPQGERVLRRSLAAELKRLVGLERSRGRGRPDDSQAR